jgi:hypothetical protein
VDMPEGGGQGVVTEGYPRCCHFFQLKNSRRLWSGGAHPAWDGGA